MSKFEIDQTVSCLFQGTIIYAINRGNEETLYYVQFNDTCFLKKIHCLNEEKITLSNQYEKRKLRDQISKLEIQIEKLRDENKRLKQELKKSLDLFGYPK